MTAKPHSDVLDQVTAQVTAILAEMRADGLRQLESYLLAADVDVDEIDETLLFFTTQHDAADRRALAAVARIVRHDLRDTNDE